MKQEDVLQGQQKEKKETMLQNIKINMPRYACGLMRDVGRNVAIFLCLALPQSWFLTSIVTKKIRKKRSPILGGYAYLPAGANRQVVEDNAMLSPLGGAESMGGPQLVSMSGVKQIRLSLFPRHCLSLSVLAQKVNRQHSVPICFVQLRRCRLEE